MRHCFTIIFALLCGQLFAAPKQEECAAIVLGGGVGGMTAALYLARANVHPIVITGPTTGGALALSSDVQNWPGERGISGIALGDKVAEQAETNGARFRQEILAGVDFSQRPFLIKTKSCWKEEYIEYRAHTCIIALGGEPNGLDVPGESDYFGRGVHTCATCDGALYRGKTVALVGGGDSAVVEAEHLAGTASKVILLVRGKAFRAKEKKRLRALLARPNVEVHYNARIEKIEGDGRQLTHLQLRTPSGPERWGARALFLAIGFHPNTALFTALKRDAQGYILHERGQETSIPGVYAVGDVSDPQFRQAITAAGDGAKAALQALDYLHTHAGRDALQAVADASPKTSVRIEEITTQKALARYLQLNQKPIMLDFYSPRCPPCRFFAPLFATWAAKLSSQFSFLKVNLDDGQELFDHFQITSIPTLVVLNAQGKVMKRCVGLDQISRAGID